MTERQFQNGELIFREGEESDKAYIIRSGTVEIFKRINQGTLLLATLSSGEIFGEMGVIDDAPRTAYASAVGDVVVKEVTREAFFSIMAGEPEEVVLMVRALMERLREANQKVTKLMNKQAQFQLASHNEVPPVSRTTRTISQPGIKARSAAGQRPTAPSGGRLGDVCAGIKGRCT